MVAILPQKPLRRGRGYFFNGQKGANRVNLSMDVTRKLIITIRDRYRDYRQIQGIQKGFRYIEFKYVVPSAGGYSVSEMHTRFFL